MRVVSLTLLCIIFTAFFPQVAAEARVPSPPPDLTPEQATYSSGSVSSVVREAFVVRPFDDIELPQASVRTVHVSRGGYLWAGTREGLVQYKSGQQTTWRQTRDGTYGLPSGVVNTIHEDLQGNIWVGTTRGISKLEKDAENFSIVVQSDESFATSLDVLEIIDFSGSLLAVCNGGTIVLVNDADVQIFSDIDFLADENLLSATVFGGDVFVGGMSGRIYRMKFTDNAFELISTRQSASPVIQLETDNESLIWLDREEGLVYSPLGDDSTRTTTVSSNINPLRGDSQGYYRAMAAETPTSAWFAAGPSIVRLKNGVTDIVRLPGRGNEVRTISVDAVGNIWIGTYYGLYYALDTSFTVLQTASAYDAGVIMSLAASDDELFLGGQNLWVGDLEGQSFSELRETLPRESREKLRINPESVGQSPITAMAVSEKNLLAGYLVGGMDVVDRSNGLVTNLTETADGKSMQGVGLSGLAEVGPDTWLGSFYFLGLYEISILNTPSAPPQIEMTQVSDEETLIGVYRLSDSRYIAVDQNAAFFLERDVDGHYTKHIIEELPDGIVFAVEPDGNGGVFLGIENVGVRHLSQGMLQSQRYAPQKIAVIEQYLERSTIWHLMMDEENSLWVATNQGIYTFDLSKQEMLAHLTYADGLPSNEFDYSPHANLRAPNGDRLFISAKVPVVFKESIRSSKDKLRLFWTDSTLNGDPFGPAVFSDNGSKATLSVDYSAASNGLLEINYGYDDHVQAIELNHAMRYAGTDEWLPQSGPTIQLTRQQSWGEVPIEIAMIDTNGDIASQPLSVTIDVKPPIYILWFFDLRYVIPGILFMAAVLLTMQRRSRDNQAKMLAEAGRKREIFEAEMRGRLSEKEILLRELHHRVGNLLTNFSANVSSMQRSAKQTETKESLANLNARLKVQKAVHQLLQRSDRTDVNVATMIQRVSHGVRDLFHDIDGRPIELDLDDIYLTYSKAQYLGLIVNELLTNTYKHTNQTDALHLASISLKTCGIKNEVRFHYRDNGEGLGPEEITAALVRKRYSELKGFGQIVGLARELGGEPRLYNDDGMNFELILKSKGIMSAPESPASSPAPSSAADAAVEQI
ncbi:two-component regulator propeller domain-containing protein [Congregibacter brevis]|uniref:histidine kinase n=1 Tax=Congregibacter brevis TaxID=3081201 RepID=A0ABZ0I9G6_9GAMM|nr:two-component regulator propeller domain-containing protein [Congregibacter sp. IMCC45268]